MYFKSPEKNVKNVHWGVQNRPTDETRTTTEQIRNHDDVVLKENMQRNGGHSN